jgi:ribose 5-phosphate isomerase B
MAKKHNNANVIAMGGRILNIETAIDIINTFINTQYEGGRHQRRLDKIALFF